MERDQALSAKPTGSGGIVKLLPETRPLAAEIMQAWALSRRYERASTVFASSAGSIELESLRSSLTHTHCSFTATCLGTDLTFADFGINSHEFPQTCISDPATNLFQLDIYDLNNPAKLEEIQTAFMGNVATW